MIPLHPLTSVVSNTGRLPTLYDLDTWLLNKNATVLDGNGVWTKITKLVRVPIIDPVQLVLKNGISLITERPALLVTRPKNINNLLDLKSCSHYTPEEIYKKARPLVSCHRPEFTEEIDYNFSIDPYELGVYLASGRIINKEKLVIKRSSNFAAFYMDDSDVFIKISDKAYIYRDAEVIRYIGKRCGHGINKKLPREVVAYSDENFFRLLGGLLDSIGRIKGQHIKRIVLETTSYSLATSILLTLLAREFNVYMDAHDGVFEINFVDDEDKLSVLLNYSNLYAHFQEFLDWGRVYKINQPAHLTRKDYYTGHKLLIPDMGRMEAMYNVETASGSICANNILVDTWSDF